MRTAILAVLMTAGATGTAVAQAVAITGATVVPVSGPPIPNATIVIADGRIAAVGANVTVPAGARVIDASGKFVYPGLIDSRSRVGLYEIGSVQASLDYNEMGDFNPAMAVHVALNAHSDLIPVTRVNGVTSVLATPSGGRVPGTAALIDLDGWTPDELSRVPYAALAVSYPQLERTGGGFGGFGGGGQMSDEEFRRRAERQVRELEEYLARAESYADRKARDAVPELDRQMEAMVPVMRGERPVAIQADTPEQIRGALGLAQRFGLRIVIVGGDQAWRVADSLAAHDVPVVLGSILSMPGRDRPFDAIYAQPAVLAARGVRFAFSTGDAANARNLPYHAAMAVAHGLAPEVALRAMTQWPAEFWGVGDALGTLEAGKVANLFIADGDPLDVRTTVEQVFIRGRPIEMESRHTRLYERFRGRPIR